MPNEYTKFKLITNRNVYNAKLVHAERSIGLTIVNADNPDEFLICMHGELAPRFKGKQGELAPRFKGKQGERDLEYYEREYSRIITGINSGVLDERHQEIAFSLHSPSAAGCSFSQ